MGKKGGSVVTPVGRHFGKYDLERVGFFDDTPPGPFDKYKTPEQLSNDAVKGRQILGGQPGDLFEKKFMRIWTGEALSEPYRDEARARIAAKKKNLGARDFLPSGPAAWHSTPDDWYGCIGKMYSHFSPLIREAKGKKQRESPNCRIKPNPIGGPGYADICLSPYPKHSNEPYDPEDKRKGAKKKPVSEGKFLSASAPLDFFPPNPYLTRPPPTGPIYVAPPIPKVTMIGTGHIYIPGPKDPGGSHAGCFNKFPEYKSTPYKVKEKYVSEPRWVGGAPTERSKYSCSIIEQGTRISCNANNYPEYTERVYPLR